MGSIADDGDEFDWEAAVREIDVACEATTTGKPTSKSNLSYLPETDCIPVQEAPKNVKSNFNFSAVSSARQSTLDRFLGVPSSNLKKFEGKANFSDGLRDNQRNDEYNGAVGGCEYMKMLNGCVEIDPLTANTWIYPVNVPRRDYQFSITRTALFSNTLVVLPTGLGKTLIAAVVMYNYFRWFPEGKIVFAAPSRPLVLQQIEACHKIVGIPQEWTIDLTGQTNPVKRASFWRDRRVFFVTPQVLEKDIQSGSCLVKHLVCLVIDEAHRAMGNYSYCVAVRELMDAPVQLRILALTATPGSKQQTIQHVIDNLQISTLEYRNESDPDVLPYTHDRKIELIEVSMGDEAVEINNLLLEVVRPFVTRLCAFGVLPKRDFQTLSPCELLNSRDKFRQEPPPGLPHMKFGEIEGYFGVLITLYHVRKLLSSHGIRPAFEMLDEKLKQGSFARLVSRNEALLKAKLLMQQSVNNGAPSPKLAKMLEVLINHFKVKDPQNSRVIIFSNFRGSVRDILNALTDIGEFVKATEFIGQSAGKTLKGQSQKVQQAVLQKFRTGGYNVIVATSIGEEGLDIMEVDLVICFDANVSPLRMIQRMGRTGRKHEGRVVVLACEGSELKGYMRKQANSKAIKKHLLNGGMSSFNFHPSPRMIPHAFRPEVHFLEMSIEEFVPRGRKVKDDNPISEPAYQNKLTDAETDLLAKYFAADEEVSWRPSLIAFPHFQAFPSPVNKVVHSSRTGMLIDIMQYLQGLTFSTDNKTFETEDKDTSNIYLGVETMEPHAEITRGNSLDHDPEKFDNHAEDTLEAEVAYKDVELQDVPRTEGMHIKGFQKQMPRLHNFLFGSEFVSVDDDGNVLVLSLPCLPLQYHSKCKNSNNMASVDDLMHVSEDCEDNTVQAKQSPSKSRSLEVKDLLESTLCKPDLERGEVSSGAEKILQTPVSKGKSKETSFSGEDYNVVHNRTAMQLADESTSDFEDSELSPRLTNFIKSGIVPESPINNADMNVTATPKGERSNFSVPAPVSSPHLQPDFLRNSQQQNEKAMQDCSLDKLDIPCLSGDRSTAVLNLNNTPRVCTLPVPVISESQIPSIKLSDTSSSKDWLLDSGLQPETVEQQRKFRRLRKLGDSDRAVPPETEKQCGWSRKLKGSRETDNCAALKLVKGSKKRAKDVLEYIDEEAEVSPEVMASDDEEEEQDDSSYEDSFIDDGVNPSASTQAGVSRTDMMAIYRRSLLSQSPFQRLPSCSTYFSPNSVVQSSRIDGSESLSGGKSNQTPEAGLESTARNSQFACDRTSTEIMEAENNKQESRKRKLSFYNAQAIPVVNLNAEFSLHSEAAGKSRVENRSDRQNGSPIQVQVERPEGTLSVIEEEDDQFYNDIDLDALEEEAANLLRHRSQCSTQGTTAIPHEPISQNIGILGSPSFDLGV